MRMSDWSSDVCSSDLVRKGLAEAGPHPLLWVLDEFPALGRLDFFEQALAFMAGYRMRALLIAQSLNQIEQAYGPNSSILDNCHVRVAFAPNDERTARRLSETMGTANQVHRSEEHTSEENTSELQSLMRNSYD